MHASEKRVVVKLGTNTITDARGRPDRAFLRRVADQVVDLMDRGYEVLLVSSGAIGSGMGLMGIDERVREVDKRQALAAIGQAHLVGAWEAAFSRHGVHVAQLLLTYDALRDRKRYLNVRNATETLLEMGVVPIVNENDTVSTEEIETSEASDVERGRTRFGWIEGSVDAEDDQGASFGDNDRLSAYVASKARAGLLIMLSDVDGLYTKPPDHPEAERVPVVEEITEAVYEMAGAKGGSILSTGGMASKLDAAKIATRAGIPVVIAHGRMEDVITRIVDGEALGTRFLPRGEGTEKERWLAIARPAGTVRIDQGAAEALGDGKHLLPAGITGVEGSFPAGSVVEITVDGDPVAKAISHLSAKEIEVVKGLHSDEARDRLGREGSCNVTRKGDVVLVDDVGQRS